MKKEGLRILICLLIMLLTGILIITVSPTCVILLLLTTIIPIYSQPVEN